MSCCEMCSDLSRVVQIKMPGELKHAIRVAKDYVADGLISVLEQETGQWSQSFDQLTSSGGWDDLVH